MGRTQFYPARPLCGTPPLIEPRRGTGVLAPSTSPRLLHRILLTAAFSYASVRAFSSCSLISRVVLPCPTSERLWPVPETSTLMLMEPQSVVEHLVCEAWYGWCAPAVDGCAEDGVQPSSYRGPQKVAWSRRCSSATPSLSLNPSCAGRQRRRWMMRACYGFHRR